MVGWLVVWVLWRINLCRLFNAKFCLYEYLVGKIFYKQDFTCLHMIKQFSSSSSSSCRAASADIPDRLSPFLPIIHRLRQVFKVTSREPCFSQEGQNVIYFDVFEQFG